MYGARDGTMKKSPAAPDSTSGEEFERVALCTRHELGKKGNRLVTELKETGKLRNFWYVNTHQNIVARVDGIT